MEVSNPHDKKFKVMVLKMLETPGEERMNIVRSLTKRKYKEALDRAEDYNK